MNQINPGCVLSFGAGSPQAELKITVAQNSVSHLSILRLVRVILTVAPITTNFSSSFFLAVNMGLSVSRLLSGLFGKKEMRACFYRFVSTNQRKTDVATFYRYIDGMLCAFLLLEISTKCLGCRLVLTPLVKQPSCTS